MLWVCEAKIICYPTSDCKSDLWCKLRNDHSWTHGKGWSRFTKTSKNIFNPECRYSFLSLQITKKSSFTTFSFCLNLLHFWKAMKTVYFATRLKNWEVTFPSFKFTIVFFQNSWMLFREFLFCQLIPENWNIWYCSVILLAFESSLFLFSVAQWTVFWWVKSRESYNDQ